VTVSRGTSVSAEEAEADQDWRGWPLARQDRFQATRLPSTLTMGLCELQTDFDARKRQRSERSPTVNRSTDAPCREADKSGFKTLRYRASFPGRFEHQQVRFR
jgi:hypothetical protein